MTKKDYIIIAHAIKDIRNWMESNEWFNAKDREAARYYQQQLIIRLGQYFLGDNKKYSHQKFTEFIDKIQTSKVQ